MKRIVVPLEIPWGDANAIVDKLRPAMYEAKATERVWRSGKRELDKTAGGVVLERPDDCTLEMAVTQVQRAIDELGWSVKPGKPYKVPKPG